MIPAAAVAAAVSASFESSGFKHPTAAMTEAETERARVMLAAALPHIEAAMLEAGWQEPEKPYIDELRTA